MSFEQRLIVIGLTNLTLYCGLGALTGKWGLRVWIASGLIGLALRLAVAAR